MKKEKFDYFESLKKAGNYAVAAAETLKNGVQKDGAEEETRNKTAECLRAAERERQAFCAALFKEFLPPIDREDLYDLAIVAERFTEEICRCAERLRFFGEEGKNGGNAALSGRIFEVCVCAAELLRGMKNYQKEEETIARTERLRECIKRGKNQLCIEEKQAWEKERSAMKILKRLESLRQINRALDAGEDVVKAAEKAALKNS